LLASEIASKFAEKALHNFDIYVILLVVEETLVNNKDRDKQQMSHYYQISWTSVDGAGSNAEQIPDKDSAVKRANAVQEDADRDGNAWSYTYKVKRCYPNSMRRDEVYNARTKKFY